MSASQAYVETHVPPTRPNPQKRNLLFKRIKKAPWWLLFIALFIAYAYSKFAPNPLYHTVWEGVKIGIETTIRVTLRAYLISLIFGLILALMRLSSSFFLYQISTFYVELVRGIPTLVLVFYVALGITPKLAEWLNEFGQWTVETRIHWEIDGQVLVDTNLDLAGKGTYLAQLKTRDIDQEYRVIMALAISYSAFMSEIFRAGIQSVHTGQIEAAKSLGLNRWKTLLLVVLPQAIRTILPPLGNDFIALLKESSLVSAVGIEDITRRGQTIAASRFRYLEVYNVVALTYLVLTLSLAILVKAIEWHLDEGRSKPAWYLSLSRYITYILTLGFIGDLWAYLRSRR